MTTRQGSSLSRQKSGASTNGEGKGGGGGGGSIGKKNIYMREHSTILRVMSRHSHDTMIEDPIYYCKDTISRIFLIIQCRNKQRKLQIAWTRWSQYTGVMHNYLKDIQQILSRPIQSTEMRTEMEIEIFFKWVLQDYALDPTGIAYSLYMCKSKAIIIRIIQGARLDRYNPREAILLQGSPPHMEEGLFTILSGAVDILILPQSSEQLTRLHSARTYNDNDEIERILTKEAVVADTLYVGAGFGELSALTNVRRAASIVACDIATPVDILVVTQQDIIDCVKCRRQVSTKYVQEASAEVMDFLRQTGLVNKAAVMDVMQAAACITKKTFPAGTLLYKKGAEVDKAYIILSGEILLDTGNFNDSKGFQGHLFQNINPSNCYILGSGSILGDEGMIGRDHTYDASAVVLSENSVMFEVIGFAIKFLGSRLGVEKYAALLYKEKPVDAEPCDVALDQLVLHGTFNCLRKVYSAQNPFRKFSRPKYKDGKANFTIVSKDRNTAKMNVREINFSTGNKNVTSKRVSGELHEVSAGTKDDGAHRRESMPTKVAGADAHLTAKTLHPGSISAEGYIVLSVGTMHHLHFIRQNLKERERDVMRSIAESTIWQKSKKKVEDSKNDIIAKMTSTNQSNQTSLSIDSNTSKYRDRRKYLMATEAYMKRKDRELLDHLVQIDLEDESVMRSLHSRGGDEQGVDIFNLAAHFSSTEFDVNSTEKSSTTFGGRSLFSEREYIADAIGTETKLEQYYKILKNEMSASTAANSLKIRRMSSNKFNSRRVSRRPSAVPTAAGLAKLGNKSPIAALSNHSSEPNTSLISRHQGIDHSGPQSPNAASSNIGLSFRRVVTSRTVGAERDPEGEDYCRRSTKFSRRQPNLSSTSGNGTLLEFLNDFGTPDVMVENKKTKKMTPEEIEQQRYDLKLKKFLDIVDDHSRKREDACNGKVDFKKDAPRTSASGRTFLEVHSKQQSLKSSSFSPNGRELLRKASRELAGDDGQTRKPSLMDFKRDPKTGKLVVEERKRLKIKAWNITANDFTEVQQKELERARVLLTWQSVVDREADESQHVRGRRKAVATSEHRCNTEKDRLKTEEEIIRYEAPGVTQDVKDLLRWKKYVAQEVLDTKHGPTRSLPSLSKRGATTVGSAMVVNIVDRPQTAPGLM